MHDLSSAEILTVVIKAVVGSVLFVHRRYKDNTAAPVIPLLHNKIDSIMKVLSVSSLGFCMSNTIEAWLANVQWKVIGNRFHGLCW